VIENNDISNFTATDIEKYWTGKLSPSEMHAMEKAAMEDPFLADALEGYKNTTTVAADLDTLKERLDKRVIAIAPVVSIKKRYPWLRVAVAIIIITGIGLLVQQIIFKNKNENSIAILKKEEKSKDVATNKDVVTNNPQAVPAVPLNQGSYLTIKPDSHSIKTQQNASNALGATISDDRDSRDTLHITAGLAVKEFKKTEETRKDSVIGNAFAFGDVKAKDVTDNVKEKKAEREVIDTSKFRNANVYNAEAVVTPNQKSSQGLFYDSYKNSGNVLNHKYSYRVVDAQNNPVPFANVMNIDDKVGTYTDIRGNFNLVSSDSVLNVQIKSLGYESNNYRIVPSSQFKSLTLKEDYYARRQILDSNRLFVSNIIKKDTAELEEPEDGWGNFNTYVQNNLQIPDDIKNKNTARSNVELSFDVDKNGNPTNIKVTKSSQCKECDEEAKRLLKEGPKWKKKGRRSKTTISISVDQK
jgi:TonB family protein